MGERRARGAATLGLVAGLLLSASTAAASAPPRDRVGPGATLVTLRAASLGGPTVASRDAAVIARVRRLVNGLPVDRPAPVCPDDLTVPYVLAFYTTPGTPPYARVSFQLGCCPEATVSLGGRVVAPPLGGPRLLATFTLIRRLIGRPTPTT